MAMTIDTTNLCSHLQKKLFEPEGVYYPIWQAMQNDEELTAVVRSRQLHIYRDGKKILIVDDMIDSGESVVDIINQTVKYHPAKTYVCATFAFFSKGVEKFDKLYEEGRLTKLYTTNLSYVPDEIRNRPWFCEVDLSRFCAKIISTLNHDESISPLLDATFRFRKLLRNSQ